VHLCAQTVWWRLVQDVQETVVADLEHLRRRFHAEPMEVANVHIDNDFHDFLLVPIPSSRAVAPTVYPTTHVTNVSDSQTAVESVTSRRKYVLADPTILVRAGGGHTTADTSVPDGQRR